MLPLSEQEIRSSFLNTSQRERKSLNLPEDFATLDWENLDFLGWRERKFENLGYVVTWLDGTPRGVLFKRVEGRTRSRAQCAWCEDVTLPNDVVYFTARRPGASGRNGSTVATLLCANFECCTNVRRPAPPAYLGFDVEAARAQRMQRLAGQLDGFMRTMLAFVD